MTRWCQRMGEDKLVALIQESLSVATKTGAANPADFSKVIVDTTVQPKAVTHPTRWLCLDPGAGQVDTVAGNGYL